MNFRCRLLIITLLSVSSIFGQETKGPKEISKGTFLGKTIPLRDMPTVSELELEGFKNVLEIKKQIPSFDTDFDLDRAAGNSDIPMEFLQTEQGTREQLTVLQNFEGSSIQEGQAVPPDPTGAVGPNHYVHAVNTVVKIFDKTGGLLAGPTLLGTFLGNGTNNGDPIVMYDHLADRYFVSQFQGNPTDPNNDDMDLIIGVSETPDPTGVYNLYTFTLDAFPDYPHYAIWHNGYYMTANKFQGNTTYVLDREAMLNGDPDPTIIGFDLPGVIRNPVEVFSPEPANLVGDDFDPDSPGYIVYLQDNIWSGVALDHLKVWEIAPDYVTPANSTISAVPQVIPTTAFDTFFVQPGDGSVSQPNTTRRLDNVAGVISYAANYRKFSDHNSWLITFNTDLGDLRSGIRWIELRNTDVTNEWEIFQEGTYAPDDGESRFMSSAGIDQDGNIGLAYNLGSANTPVAIRYTGRYNGDELGMMTFPESVIINGTGWQTITERFGDYGHLSMDPDGITFWHTSQYFQGVDQWRTRIASFTLNNGFAEDIGVFNFDAPQSGQNLTTTETVTVKIFNFGTLAQSNFEVELIVDGISVTTEMFTETIEPFSEATYTFNQTLDLSTPQTTYEIQAKTNLVDDLNTPNDSFTIEIDNTTLSTENATFNAGEFIIFKKEAKLYNIEFTTVEDFGPINYSVYNTIGQEVLIGDLERKGNKHGTTLDFTASPMGVYFVTLTNGKFTASKRVIVTE